MTYTKLALLDAINLLVGEDDPRYSLEALEAVLTLRQRFPVRLTGPLADLNALIALREDDPEKWPPVQALIDGKRAEADLPLCWPEPKFDKREYQRRLMALRRERSGRALEIENMQREDRDKLRGVLRLEYERRQLATWGEQVDAIIAARKEAAGGKICKNQIDAIKLKFWEELDAALDEREAAVRIELMKPPHQRRKI